MVKPLVLILLVACVMGSEVRLEVPGQIAPGVPTEGTVVVIDAPSQAVKIEFPEIPGVTFELDSGTSHQTTIVNGVVSSSDRIPVIITATQPGPLSISGLAVILRDNTRLVLSGERLVQVAAGKAELSGDAEFQVTFSSPTVYVGQPVTMEFRAAMRDETIRIIAPGIAPPTQAVVLATQDKQEDSLLTSSGARWRTETTRWTISFTAPGTVEVRGQQEYYRCRTNFGQWVAIGGARRAAVKPTTLIVKDVPTIGRPADWSGVVGAVTVTGTLDRERISAGEGARLTVSIAGPQTSQMARPMLPDIPGLRVYPHEEGQVSDQNHRTFMWDLVPSAAGKYSVPIPSVPWFDPALERFARTDLPPLTLDVLPGRSQGLNVAGSALNHAPLFNAGPALALPAPLRGHGARSSPPLVVAATALMALVIGLTLGWGSTRKPRTARSHHRGRALAAALRANDLPAAAHVLQALRPTATTAAQQAAAQRLENALATARFGNGTLGPVAEDLAELEGLP